MPIDRQQYLTPTQVGQALAVSPETVRRWARTGRLRDLKIDTHELPGGRWLIHRDVLKTSPK